MTAAKACQQDKNWRSSIGHCQASPQVDSANGKVNGCSALPTNTSDTEMQSVCAEDANKNGATLRDHAKSNSVGSSSSTEQVNLLLEECRAQAHPLVIEWPRPPRCTLTHLNEEHVAQHAESRNHHPVRFPVFEKGTIHPKGLPSYTPRPGPFPAQIGTTPRDFCAYEIRNDIEYHPDPPSLEDARIQSAESQDLHNDRYLSDNARYLHPPDLDAEALRTSISLPDQHVPYGMGNGTFEPTPYPTQSAPADMQTFTHVPWTEVAGKVGSQQPGYRYSSQESYYSQSSGNGPYQAAAYFGSSPNTYGGQQHGYERQPESSLRCSSEPVRPQKSSMPALPTFVNQSAFRNPWYPPPPQGVLREKFYPVASNYSNRGYDSGSFTNGVRSQSTAVKKIETPGITGQSQQNYASTHPSPAPSRQLTPNPYSGATSVAQQASGSGPLSGAASWQSSCVLLPGFSASGHGTEAPTFATADDFSRSYDDLIRAQGPLFPRHGTGLGNDPALEANYSLSLQSQNDHANHTTIAPGVATGPLRNKKNYPILSAPGGKFQDQRSCTFPKHGKQPFSGNFSPPKPRMKGKHAANVLNRYNRWGLSQNRASEAMTTGGFMEPLPAGPHLMFNGSDKKDCEQHQIPQVVFPADEALQHLRKGSYDQLSSSPSQASTASNFSDDFILKDARTGRKKAKGNVAGAKKAKRGAKKETDTTNVVKSENDGHTTKNAQNATEARAARVNRRSSVRTEI